jgi:hypothetical protein
VSPQPEPVPGAVRCLFVGRRPRPELFEPISMALGNGVRYRTPKKPLGGLWTCPDDPRGRSAWRTWNHQARTGFTRYRRTWRLTAVEPRIYTIDTPADLRVALDRWPHQAFPDLPLLYNREIDYAAMLADGYDAVELTEDGHWATRLTFPDSLYGWDVPTILWLRWAFSDVSPVSSRGHAGRCSDRRCVS